MCMLQEGVWKSTGSFLMKGTELVCGTNGYCRLPVERTRRFWYFDLRPIETSAEWA